MTSWIDGNKTYIGMILGGILMMLVTLNVVQWNDVEWIAVMIATWTGVSIAHKGNKIIKKLKQDE